MKEKYSNFRGFKKIVAYEIEINEGDGTPEDPVYREKYYITEDGFLIGKLTNKEYSFRKFAGGDNN
jgi:hypothetical protein